MSSVNSSSANSATANATSDHVEEIVNINSANYNNDGNSFTFNFNKIVEFKKGAKVGLVNCSMYNSTQNITAFYGNNQFTMTWIDNTTLSVTIPDGYYQYSDIQSLFQYYMVENNWYYIQNNTAIYPYQISTNIPRYSAQLNINSVPSATQATDNGYSLPSGATWTFPTNPTTPQITFNAGLGKIFGFVSNLTFPVGGPTTTNYAYISDTFPIISPVYVYVVTLNLLNTNLSTSNNNVFTSIPLNNSFGELVTFGTGASPQTVDIYPSRYSQITVRFLDQNLNNIMLKDPELSLQLVIRYKI